MVNLLHETSSRSLPRIISTIILYIYICTFIFDDSRVRDYSSIFGNVRHRSSTLGHVRAPRSSQGMHIGSEIDASIGVEYRSIVEGWRGEEVRSRGGHSRPRAYERNVPGIEMKTRPGKHP